LGGTLRFDAFTRNTLVLPLDRVASKFARRLYVFVITVINRRRVQKKIDGPSNMLSLGASGRLACAKTEHPAPILSLALHSLRQSPRLPAKWSS
jgi:hypothetical protein